MDGSAVAIGIALGLFMPLVAIIGPIQVHFISLHSQFKILFSVLRIVRLIDLFVFTGVLREHCLVHCVMH